MSIFKSCKKGRKALLVNTQMTVYLENGTVFTIENADMSAYLEAMDIEKTDEQVEAWYFDRVKDMDLPKTKEEVAYMSAKEKQAEGQRFEQELQVLLEASDGEFCVKDGSLYLYGINLSVPYDLAKRILELEIAFRNAPNEEAKLEAKEKYVSLGNFWKWCALCPNPESREDLYNFIKDKNIKINRNGHFFAYRRVVSVGPDNSYVQFISNEFLHKKTQKKNPRNYYVYKVDGKYEIHGYYDAYKDDEDDDCQRELLGNLYELYQELPTLSQGQQFTDNRTRTFDIRIGKEVVLDPNKCDIDNRNPCSSGLHVCVDKDHGCGDTPILVLVNPKNVIAVPKYDDTKMRVCAYLPVAVLKEDEFLKVLDSAETLELADEYLLDEVRKLDEMVSATNVQDSIKHGYLPEMTEEELQILNYSFKMDAEVLYNRMQKSDF